METDKLARYFAEYADCHLHPMNVACHAVGIPLITYHVAAMLDWVRLPPFGGVELTAGVIATVAVLAWYATLDLLLTPVMALWFFACLFVARAAPDWTAYAAAAIGWTVQLLGHAVWEKRSPAFLTNLVQALIGPLYFADKLLKNRGRTPP